MDISKAKSIVQDRRVNGPLEDDWDLVEAANFLLGIFLRCKQPEVQRPKSLDASFLEGLLGLRPHD